MLRSRYYQHPTVNFQHQNDRHFSWLTIKYVASSEIPLTHKHTLSKGALFRINLSSIRCSLSAPAACRICKTRLCRFVNHTHTHTNTQALDENSSTYEAKLTNIHTYKLDPAHKSMQFSHSILLATWDASAWTSLTCFASSLLHLLCSPLQPQKSRRRRCLPANCASLVSQDWSCGLRISLWNTDDIDGMEVWGEK